MLNDGVTINSNLDTLFNNDLLISTTTNNLETNLNNLGVTIGVSSNNLGPLRLNSIYNYLVQQLDGKTDDSTFAALQSAFGALDTAYSVYTVANELWKASQTTNNGAQQSEIQGLQGQHDSLEQRVDTLEEKIGISFDNTAIRMGTLGTSIANVDVDVALLKTDLGTSF